MNSGRQLAAARALLKWSLDDLAKHADIARPTISRMENDEVSPNTTTVKKVTYALNKAGVVFTENGVEFAGDKITKLDGKEWFLDLLDDVYETLKEEANKELLIFAGDNRLSPPEVIESFRKLRMSGVQIKEMVEQDNDYLMGPEKDYRWIPSEHFQNYNTIIYANKVCNDFGGRGLLIQNKEWAATERNKFNLLWSLLPELDVESTSNVRY